MAARNLQIPESKRALKSLRGDLTETTRLTSSEHADL